MVLVLNGVTSLILASKLTAIEYFVVAPKRQGFCLNAWLNSELRFVCVMSRTAFVSFQGKDFTVRFFAHVLDQCQKDSHVELQY